MTSPPARKSIGKRLAYIDVNQLKAVDPQQFVDQRINVMGKLEPVEEGSETRSSVPNYQTIQLNTLKSVK